MDTSAWKPDDLLRGLQPWIAKHRRAAWLPRVEDRPTSPRETSFCAQPWLNQVDDWPYCALCTRPLQLFLQLDLDSLPSELGAKYGSGFLQLYYCRHTADGSCHGESGWEAFSDACSRVRIVRPTAESPSSITHNCDRNFPPRAIVGWDRIDDCPNPGEHDELGLVYDYGFRNNTPAEIHCPELDIHCTGMRFLNAAAEGITSHGGDKLAGWPNWVQGVEYPHCPRCDALMQFIMQVDSEDHIPFMFGDSGMGYVTQCPHHLDVVAFGWACS